MEAGDVALFDQSPRPGPDDELILGAIGGEVVFRITAGGADVPLDTQTDIANMVAQGAECLKILAAYERQALRIVEQQTAEITRVREFYAQQLSTVDRNLSRVLATLEAIAKRVKELGGYGSAKSIGTAFGRFGYRKAPDLVLLEDEAAALEFARQYAPASVEHKSVLKWAQFKRWVEANPVDVPGVTRQPGEDRFDYKIERADG